jgi:hypothetical protein
MKLRPHVPPYLQPDFNFVEGVVSLDGNKYEAMLIPVWSVSSPNKKGIKRVVISFGRVGLSHPNAMIGMYIRSKDGGLDSYSWGTPTRYIVVNDTTYLIDFDGRSRNGKFILKAVDNVSAIKVASIEFVFTKLIAKISNVGNQPADSNSR